MGKKKNRNQGGDDDNNIGEADRAKGFVSHQAAVRREAAEADKDVEANKPNNKKNKNKGAIDQDLEEELKEGEMIQPKKRNKRKGGQEFDDDAFDKIVGDEKDAEGIVPKIIEDDAEAEQNVVDSIDVSDSIDQAGGGQKKKKGGRGAAFGKGGAQNDIAGAFEEVDSDEINAKEYAKKGGKQNKKEKYQHKKKKKQDSDQEDEGVQGVEVAVQDVPSADNQAGEPEEEGKVPEDQPDAQGEDEKEDDTLPLNVIYCQKCGLPPEYCMFGQKDSSACQEWLKANHPALYNEIYNPDGAVASAEVPVQDSAAGDDAATNEAGEPTGENQPEEGKAADGEKPKKKVKFGKAPEEQGIINVYRLKRGGRKMLCQMTGFEHYTKDLKGLASKFAKKFSCGCNVAQDDIYGECISIQGDVEDMLLDLLETDKDMMKLGIPPEKVNFEDKGNKKGRKKA